MKRRDPEIRQRLILEAALAEFAAYGRAGARIERIAERAGCSIGLIYSRFGNKEQLFDAVGDALATEADAMLKWDAEDLAGYAGRVFDAQLAHPEVMRLSLWRLLQAPQDQDEAPPQELLDKLDALSAAQKAGIVSQRLDAAQLVLLTVAISSMWSTLLPELAGLLPDADDRRATIVEAVRRLAEP